MARDKKWSSLMWGLALVAFGTLFWLDRLDRLDASIYLRWWPVALIGFGVAHLLERRFFGGVTLVLLGLAFMPAVPFFGVLRFSQIIGLWPLTISFAGVTLVAQAMRPPLRDVRATPFHTVAVMGASWRAVGAGEYVAGDAIAVMGGCEIDFRAADTLREGVVDVIAFWGGIEIVVPKGWGVDSRVAMILGAQTDLLGPAEPGKPMLVVRGTVIMGGIEFRNSKEEQRA